MTQLDDILKLSLSERILWAKAIWNSIASEPDSSSFFELSPEQKKLLDEEMEDNRINPDKGSSWEEVKARLSKK